MESLEKTLNFIPQLQIKITNEMVAIVFQEEEIAYVRAGLIIELEKAVARKEIVKNVLEKLIAESSNFKLSDKEVRVIEKPEFKKETKKKLKKTRKGKARKMPVIENDIESVTDVIQETKMPNKPTPITENMPEIEIENMPEIEIENMPEIEIENMPEIEIENMPENKIQLQDEVKHEIQFAIEVGDMPGVKSSPRNDGLDTFLYQVLQSEDRYFSLDSLLSLAFIEYKVEDEFKKEDLVKKVKKNLTVMGRKGMIEIKRPREGKRFLYKMN